MTISAADVRTIARLARLDLSDDEVGRFQTELSKILEYVAQLERRELASGNRGHVDVGLDRTRRRAGAA